MYALEEEDCVCLNVWYCIAVISVMYSDVKTARLFPFVEILIDTYTSSTFPTCQSNLYLQMSLDRNCHWQEEHASLSVFRCSGVCMPHHGHYALNRRLLMERIVRMSMVGVMDELGY